MVNLNQLIEDNQTKIEAIKNLPISNTEKGRKLSDLMIESISNLKNIDDIKQIIIPIKLAVFEISGSSNIDTMDYEVLTKVKSATKGNREKLGWTAKILNFYGVKDTKDFENPNYKIAMEVKKLASMTSEQWKVRKENYSKTKENNEVFFDANKYIETIEKLLLSSNPIDVLVGFLGATGRRNTEVFNINAYIPTNDNHKLIFNGQLKTNTQKTYDIETIFDVDGLLKRLYYALNTDKVKQLINNLEKDLNLSFKDYINNELSDEEKKLFNDGLGNKFNYLLTNCYKENFDFVHKANDGQENTVKTLRKLAVTYIVKRILIDEGKEKSDNARLNKTKEVLGHDDIDTAQKYLVFNIDTSKYQLKKHFLSSQLSLFTTNDEGSTANDEESTANDEGSTMNEKIYPNEKLSNMKVYPTFKKFLENFEGDSQPKQLINLMNEYLMIKEQLSLFTANDKESTINDEESTANDEASTANDETSTINDEESTANDEASTANDELNINEIFKNMEDPLKKLEKAMSAIIKYNKSQEKKYTHIAITNRALANIASTSLSKVTIFFSENKSQIENYNKENSFTKNQNRGKEVIYDLIKENYM